MILSNYKIIIFNIMPVSGCWNVGEVFRHLYGRNVGTDSDHRTSLMNHPIQNHINTSKLYHQLKLNFKIQYKVFENTTIDHW